MEQVKKKKLTFKEKWENIKATKTPSWIKDKNSLFYYTLLLILFGFAFYLFTIFSNNFTAICSGDYVYQSIPFFHNGYDDWWHFLKTGEFPFWDSNTGFGADNLANNAFYYVMDPLFLPVLLFPRSFLPHAMLIMMIVKMIIGALSFRYLLKYLGVKEIYARVFAICYGFGGWIIFYQWFAGFMETISFFPIVLLGIEKVLKKERPTTLVIGLFLMGLSNFYFLVPTCIGCVFYSLFRFFQTVKTRKSYENVQTMGIGVLAFALGLGSAAFLTLPAFLNVLNYSRASNSYLSSVLEAFKAKEMDTFWGLIFDWNKVDGTGYGFRVAYPLMSFLFPTTDGRSVPIMNFSGNRYDQVASSLFIYTPCIIIFFASMFKSAKEKKISHFIAIGFWVMVLFIPFFYYLMLGFSSAYGRWEYLPSTFMIMYCAISFNKREEYKKWMFDWAYVVSIVLMIISIYLANSYHYQYPNRVEAIDSRWPVIVVQLIYITVIYILIRRFYKSKKFMNVGVIFLLAETILMGGYYATYHTYANFYTYSYLNGKDNVTKETEIVAHINETDDDFFRIQSGRIINSGTNIQMAENYNGTAFFHSQYNSYMDQFLHWSRIITSYGNWSASAIEKRPLLDSFLGVKYYLTTQVETNFKVISDLNDPQNSTKVYHVQPNIPFGYTYLDDGFNYGKYKIYKNDNFLDMGFSFDTFVDPHIQEKEDDKLRVFSDFFTYKYSHNDREAVDNDYNFMTSAVLETKDIEEIKELYPEEFETGKLKQRDRVMWDALKLKRENRDFTKTVYRLPSYFDPVNPLAYQTVGDTSDQNSKLQPYRDICVYEPLGSDVFNFKDEMTNAIHFISRINQNNRYSIFLINDDGICISMDNFLQYDNYYKVFRTMYLKDNIKQIIMVPHPMANDYSITKRSLPTYFYQIRYSDYMDVINEQKQYALYDTEHSYNTYKFKTDYDQRRMIVLQVPYDKGWSCISKDKDGKEKELKVYKADGGFCSVMGELGETEYTFNFITPHFKTGLVISIGSFITTALVSIYFSCQQKRELEKLEPRKRKFVVVRKIKK